MDVVPHTGAVALVLVEHPDIRQAAREPLRRREQPQMHALLAAGLGEGPRREDAAAQNHDELLAARSQDARRFA